MLQLLAGYCNGWEYLYHTKEDNADGGQAPIIPKVKRPASAQGLKSNSHSPNIPQKESTRDRGLLGITSKKDKRIIKHSALVSRIEKSKASSKKRRRPSKKLVTNLESLANALPEAPENKKQDVMMGDVKIRQRSLKSRPGAMKRKEKLATIEKERFNKSMAQMMGSAAVSQVNHEATGSAEPSTEGRNKWAALRGFIQQTMEQRPEASN